jgi:hypothetical protein
MSLSTSRAELAAAIRAADSPALRVYDAPSGTFATPCVRLHPAAPWIAPSVLAAGRRVQQWEVWVVTGKMDARATFNKMEQMVSKITIALDKFQGWSSIDWDRPAPTDMGGALYLAVRGVIQTVQEV